MQMVDLNSANEQDLTRIPGMDPNRARQIVEFRNQNGSFKTLDDLRRISGMPNEVIKALKKAGVTVSKQPAA